MLAANNINISQSLQELESFESELASRRYSYVVSVGWTSEHEPKKVHVKTVSSVRELNDWWETGRFDGYEPREKPLVFYSSDFRQMDDYGHYICIHQLGDNEAFFVISKHTDIEGLEHGSEFNLIVERIKERSSSACPI